MDIACTSIYSTFSDSVTSPLLTLPYFFYYCLILFDMFDTHFLFTFYLIHLFSSISATSLIFLVTIFILLYYWRTDLFNLDIQLKFPSVPSFTIAVTLIQMGPLRLSIFFSLPLQSLNCLAPSSTQILLILSHNAFSKKKKKSALTL